MFLALEQFLGMWCSNSSKAIPAKAGDRERADGAIFVEGPAAAARGVGMGKAAGAPLIVWDKKCFEPCTWRWGRSGC